MGWYGMIAKRFSFRGRIAILIFFFLSFGSIKNQGQLYIKAEFVFIM